MYEYKTFEKWCENNGQKIYGIAYVPEITEKVPLVIFAHELCNTHAAGTEYAKRLASNGIAVYTFDFRGGSYDSRSDGETTSMSVMSEASDLEAVIAEAKTWDFVDAGKVALLGGSQGGMAAAVAAERNLEDVKGLMLLYPAFVIQDNLYRQFSSLDSVPEQFKLLDRIMVGKNFASDVWDYDLFGRMKSYTRPVLLMHGDEDSVVDVSYAKKAAECYPDVRLHIIKGADHSFVGSDFDLVMDYILDYLAECGILK